MQIQTTAAFIDKHATNPDDAEVPAGKKMTVTAERGAELIGLGLATDLTPKAAAPRKKAPRANVAKHKPVTPSPVPPAPASNAAPAAPAAPVPAPTKPAAAPAPVA